MSNQIKLAVLHAKTDHDLRILVEHELDRALTLSQVAASKESAFHAEAEKVYRKAVTLLLKAPIIQDGRVRIDAKLKELRFRLDLVPAGIRAHPAAVASNS